MNEKIFFAKTKLDAIIPTKRDEDGAFDIYACFEEESMVIRPFETKLVPTGISSAFSNDYTIIFYERGSTGVKGLKLSAGVIDSGFRGEWFVMIYNANTKPIIITKELDKENLKDDYVIYPYNKAIAQGIIIQNHKLNLEEVSLNEVNSFKSERGTGCLGSSTK